MSIKRRIVSSTIANFVGVMISAVTQIATVPILTSAWGTDRYGLWLMLTTIPTYFALSDLGFSSAATSEMAIHSARGDQDQVRKTFQSTWALINLFSGLVIVGALFGILFLPLLNDHFSWIRDQQTVLILLALYSCLIMNSRIALGGLRATQNYARGTMMFQIMTVIEVTSTLALALGGHGFVACTFAMCCVQVLNLISMVSMLHQSVPWLRFGVRDASRQEVWRLLGPALAAMAIPAALALNLQGMIIVAGAFISPTAAATLAAVRSVSRVAIQLVSAINRATMPELSAAGARDQRIAHARIVALNLASVGFLLIPGALVFAFLGHRIIEMWTHGNIQPQPAFVTLIAFAMVIHGLWYYTSNMLLASNTHTLVARSLLIVSLSGIALSIPFAQAYGLLGVGSSIVLTELTCLVAVLRAAFNINLLRFSDFKSALRLEFWRT